jgi:CrcB protein
MPDGSAERSVLPIDPDQLPESRFRRDVASLRRRWDVLLVISLGGMVGASARYALSLALPTRSGQFPWGTFLTNISGAAVLGLLLVLLTERIAPGRYLRPFLGTGVIGAYTTFSTYAVETDLLVRDGHAAIAVGYLLLSLVAGLVAVWLGIVAGRSLAGVGRQHG